MSRRIPLCSLVIVYFYVQNIELQCTFEVLCLVKIMPRRTPDLTRRADNIFCFLISSDRASTTYSSRALKNQFNKNAKKQSRMDSAEENPQNESSIGNMNGRNPSWRSLFTKCKYSELNQNRLNEQIA